MSENLPVNLPEFGSTFNFPQDLIRDNLNPNPQPQNPLLPPTIEDLSLKRQVKIHTLEPGFVGQRSIVRRKRSTLTPQNALKFKHVFDQAILTKQDQFLTVEQGSVSSLHVKLADALKWLVENFDHEHETNTHGMHPLGGYIDLRVATKMSDIIHPDKGEGVYFHFTTKIGSQIIGSLTLTDPEKQRLQQLQKEVHASVMNIAKDKSWRDKILVFVEDPSQQVFESKDQYFFTPEDQNYIKNMLQDIVTGLTVTETFIRIQK